MNRKFVVLALSSLIVASQPALSATQLANFTVVDPSAGLGSGPFGSVSVTENAGSLVFTETLAPGFRIHAGNANHNAFTFSILGDPAVTVSNLTSGFSAISTSSGTNVSAPPFGDYFTAIACTSACGHGYNGGFSGPLTFTVSSASALSLTSLGFLNYNGNKVYFTSDVVNIDGFTGNVGAVINSTPAVPEPATWAMMTVGFGAMGASVRYRRRSTHAIAA